LKAGPLIPPRRGNLWVTDTFEWRPGAQLPQPTNPIAGFGVFVPRQLPFEPVLPSPVDGVVSSGDAVTQLSPDDFLPTKDLGGVGQPVGIVLLLLRGQSRVAVQQ
jgi:hypothetical protein